MSIAFNKVKKGLTLSDTMPFGKYQGLTVARVIQDSPQYVNWMIKNSAIFFLDEKALQTLEERSKHIIGRPYGTHWKYCTPKVNHNVDYDFEDTIEWDNIWH